MPKDGPQIDLRRVLPDELADALSLPEIGQYTRLMLRLLAQPDHALPTDAAVLSRWAGTGDAVSPRVLSEFNTVDGRLRCARVDAVLCETESRRRLLSDAGKRGNERRWSAGSGATDTPDASPGDRLAIGGRSPPDRVATKTPLATQDAGSVRASHARPPAHAALQRSEIHATSERSSAEPPMPERAHLAGAIYEGLEAAARAKLDEFRRGEAIKLLERAIKSWLQADRIERREIAATLTTPRRQLPLPNARHEAMKIAAWPRATPAACEIAIQRCEQEHNDPDRGPVSNPIGFLVGALGVRKGGKPLEPWLSEQSIVEKWAEAERKYFDSAKTLAAASAAARRFDEAQQRTTTTTGGPAQSTTANGA